MEEFEQLAASATRVDAPTSTGAVVAAHVFGAADAPPVVLVHGGAGSWNHWARTIPALATQFRLLALDLPGCGDSTLPDGLSEGATVDLAGLDLLAAAIGEAIEQLVPAPRRFGVAGFSFGGVVVGRAVAARLDRRVALLALIGAGGLGVASSSDVALRAAPRQAPWEERSAAHRHNLAALMLAEPDRADELAAVLHEHNVRHNRFRLGDVPSTSALVDVLGTTTAPLLWITGQRDSFAAGVQSRRRELVLAARPDAELVEVPDSGHWAAYERPDVVNPLLLDRFNRALAGPGSAGG
jgi:pimeloyl-ACP methyl ester carboxylesterase